MIKKIQIFLTVSLLFIAFILPACQASRQQPEKHDKSVENQPGQRISVSHEDFGIPNHESDIFSYEVRCNQVSLDLEIRKQSSRQADMPGFSIENFVVNGTPLPTSRDTLLARILKKAGLFYIDSFFCDTDILEIHMMIYLKQGHPIPDNPETGRPQYIPLSLVVDKTGQLKLAGKDKYIHLFDNGP